MPNPELELLGLLKANLDAENRALDARDMVAYEALCEREARLFDTWRAVAHAEG